MKLVLVRHGRPDENDESCPRDPPLGAEGRDQADSTAAFLAQERITRIVSSPMNRALQTARPLAERLHLQVEVIDGWAEADRRTTRYRSTESLRALGDAEWNRFLADPVGYLGGDAAAFGSEVLGALAATIGAGGRDEHVAVFAHGLPINVVLSNALGLARIIHFAPGYASLTRLRVLPSGAVGVVSVNERGHLAQKAARTPPND